MKIFIFVILFAVIFLSIFSFSFIRDSSYFSSFKVDKIKGFFFKDPSQLERAGSKASGVIGAVVSDASSEPANALSERNYCSSESRDVESCEVVQSPVCGWYTEDTCDPLNEECVRSVFPNECEACATDGIIYWTEGDCPLHS